MLEGATGEATSVMTLRPVSCTASTFYLTSITNGVQHSERIFIKGGVSFSPTGTFVALGDGASISRSDSVYVIG